MPSYVSRLRRYPVKSCRGEDLEQATVEPWGFAGDRRWMVVDPDGGMITARKVNQLVLVTAEIISDGLLLRAPGMPDQHVRRPVSGPLSTVQVWQDSLAARAAEPTAAAWVSEIIGRPATLVYLDDPRRRRVDPRYAAADDVVSFADGYPILIASEQSLNQLNDWIAAGPRPAEGPIPITRFRPSLVVAGTEPFAEDNWTRIQVGSVQFRVVKPCSRCVLTTVDPDTARRTKEPLLTLTQQRLIGGKPLFGMNAIPDAPYGPIKIGDPVTVLSEQPSEAAI